jgi:predicted phosphodiesterase
MRRLLAIADLHVSHKFNLEALQSLDSYEEDGLIICGDVGEKLEHLRTVFELTTQLFHTVFWVPGNHELYTLPADESGLRGEMKYKACIAVANEYGVITPEDEFVRYDGEGGPCLICPIFTLYDYSFRPDHVSREDALAWAEEENIMATDEALLHPDPYETRDKWCEELVAATVPRLEAATAHGLPLVIINHWPLRRDLITIPRIPRFSLWCGTKATHDWHKRFNAKVVVTGHLHVRRTDHIDGVRFEEVSLGYPQQWEDARNSGRDINNMLREILPGPTYKGDEATIWRRV